MAKVERRDRVSSDKKTYSLYVDGNLAYVSEPAIPESERKQLEEKKSYVDSRTKRNRAKARSINLRSVAFLAVGISVVALSCTFLIKSQAALSYAKKQVAVLSDELIELTDSNDAMELRIERSVDIEAIRDKAINEFGMVYPTVDQVINYNVETSDYMEQYADVE